MTQVGGCFFFLVVIYRSDRVQSWTLDIMWIICFRNLGRTCFFFFCGVGMADGENTKRRFLGWYNSYLTKKVSTYTQCTWYDVCTHAHQLHYEESPSIHGSRGRWRFGQAVGRFVGKAIEYPLGGVRLSESIMEKQLRYYGLFNMWIVCCYSILSIDFFLKISSPFWHVQRDS